MFLSKNDLLLSQKFEPWLPVIAINGEYEIYIKKILDSKKEKIDTPIYSWVKIWEAYLKILKSNY